MSEELSWAERRRANAKLQAERLTARKAAESAQASEYLKQFAVAAKKNGLAPIPLVAINSKGATAATGLVGWYLRADKSAGFDTHGNYYFLQRDLSFIDRLRGVSINKSDPPLILGAGGRDGETMDLTARLSELLPDWRNIAFGAFDAD